MNILGDGITLGDPDAYTRTIATYGKHALDPYRVRYYVEASNTWYQSKGFVTLAEAERFALLMLDGEATKAMIIEVQSW